MEAVGHPRVLRVAQGRVHGSLVENLEFPGPAGLWCPVLGVW